MAVTNRTLRNYSVPKDSIRATFLANAVVNAWSVDGRFIKARLADTVNANNPGAPITRIIENYRLIPFADVYNQWFTAIPASDFNTATVGFTATDVLIAINREEP